MTPVEKVRKATVQVRERTGDHYTKGLCDAIDSLVDEAVAAERERCLKIVYDRRYFNSEGPPQAEWLVATMSDIRSGE